MFSRLLEFIKENKTSEFLQAWEETQAGIDSLLTEVDDERHGTLLHWACIKRNIEIVYALLQAGASPDTQDSIGRTPLHYACRYGFDKAVELLLERVGSNRDLLLLQDNATKTALSLSVKYNHASVMLLMWLH